MVEPNVAANSNQEQFDLAQSLEVGNAVEFDTSEGVISGEVIKIVGENPKKIHIEGNEGKQYTLVPDGVEANEENAALWSTPKEYPGPKDMLINMSRKEEADLISYDTVRIIE